MDLPIPIISLANILALPAYIGIPGLLACAMLVLSAVRSLLSFRPLRAASRLAFALILLIILSNGGEVIMQLASPAPSSGGGA